MDDIFGKVVSIFLAVCIMFGMPFIYMTERSKSAKQMYILSEITRFVDSACNIGFIDREMMQRLYMDMSFSDGIAGINILHESEEYATQEREAATGDDYVKVSTFYDEEDIWDTVEKKERYKLLKGDYLKVTVSVANSFSLFPFIDDNTVTAIYGGSVKYETD